MVRGYYLKKIHTGGKEKMKVNVYVTLRESVVDPQGTATKEALEKLGHEEIERVRIGKLIELELDEKTADIDAKVKAMCDQLLVNKVIEEYRYEIEEATRK